MVQLRPELVLRDAGLQRLGHARHADLADRDRAPHALQLLAGLDGARELEDPLAFDELEARLLQGTRTEQVGTVDGEAQPPAARRSLDEVRDLGRPSAGHRPGVLGRIEEAVDPRRAHLADGREPLRHALAVVAGELEQHRLALRRHHAVAGHVVQRPDRHVARVGRVADVERIDEQRGGAVLGAQHLLKAAIASDAQRPQLRGREFRRQRQASCGRTGPRGRGRVRAHHHIRTRCSGGR